MKVIAVGIIRLLRVNPVLPLLLTILQTIRPPMLSISNSGTCALQNPVCFQFPRELRLKEPF